jgi:hypothetical protein
LDVADLVPALVFVEDFSVDDDDCGGCEGDVNDKTVEEAVELLAELCSGLPLLLPVELLLVPAVPPRSWRQLVRRSCRCRLLGRPGNWGGTKRRLLYDGKADTDTDKDSSTPELIIIHTTFRKEKLLVPLVRESLILNDLTIHSSVAVELALVFSRRLQV